MEHLSSAVCFKNNMLWQYKEHARITNAVICAHHLAVKRSNKGSKIGLMIRGYVLHFRFRRIKCRVGVIVKRHSHTRVPHYVLQRFWIHARVRHISAERMPQQMRRQFFLLVTTALIVLPSLASDSFTLSMVIEPSLSALSRLMVHSRPISVL